MSKTNGKVTKSAASATAVQGTKSASEQGAKAAVVAEQKPAATNKMLTYRKNHPNNRCSYGVEGVSGIVVFDMKLFAGGKPPKSITLDCDLVAPVTK